MVKFLKEKVHEKSRILANLQSLIYARKSIQDVPKFNIMALKFTHPSY